VKQADGKVGFEFEAKAPGRRGTRPVRSAPLRVLGNHPRDRQPIELHAGRYGPYVKHGATNATLPDRDAVDSLSLEQAIALVDEKAGRAPAGGARRTTATRTPRKGHTAGVAKPAPTSKPARRVAPARGARQADAATALVPPPRTSTATTRAIKRASGQKASAGVSAAKTKPSLRTAVVKKRAGTTKRKGTASVRTAGSKSAPARKPVSGATTRKSKRR
jgi:hypothetical protein